MTREEREDAIDIIQSILDKYEEDECLATEITIGDEDIKAFKMAIKALEQEPRWIPVSERLPEEHANVLICDIDGDVYIAYMSNIIYANRIVWSDASSFDIIKSVIAWMPLPKTCREVEE